jgi:cobalt-zinc-cadmium efflux system protein
MSRERRLLLALGLNLLVVVVQAVMGILAGSVGLLADAGHNLSDVAALVVSMVAIRLATRPATARRSFGWHGRRSSPRRPTPPRSSSSPR